MVMSTGSSRLGPGAASAYYVSNEGSDRNDGKSPETPWRTLDRVNAEPLAPGDAVLFRRGDRWRGQLLPRSGADAGYVTYGAYGSGDKPLLLGSVARDSAEHWRPEGQNIWATAGLDATGKHALPCDVGNIIFDHGQACGVEVWNEVDLKAQGDYWYDEQAHVLKLYSPKCPASCHSSIECALRMHIIDQSNASYVIYENLALRYGGAHGIGGGNTRHIIVRDCDLSYIGGGDQYGGEGTVRYGNGVEFWGDAHDSVVERCRLWEIYDAALTNQNNGPNVKQYNLYYRHNLVWNSEYSFEYWNRPENSLTHHVHFENNTCVNAGYGWGHSQRPDPSGRHLCFYSSPAPAHGIYIHNNIFLEATTNAFYAPGWPPDAIAALEMDHNCWVQSEGAMIRLEDRSYTMAQFAEYQADTGKEPNSIAADPCLADAARGDFRLAERSPCVDAGADLGLQADFDGNPIPQGAAPDIGAYERGQGLNS